MLISTETHITCDFPGGGGGGSGPPYPPLDPHMLCFQTFNNRAMQILLFLNSS